MSWVNASTVQGSSTNVETYLSPVELQSIAKDILQDAYPKLNSEIDRIDIRPAKGTAKIVFVQHYVGIQLDAVSGELLHIGVRNGDLIENIHDGSIVDKALGFKEISKLIYTSTLALSLLGFTISGFWLWYGPKRMKRK